MKFYQSLCFCCVVLSSLTCRDKGTEPPPPGPEPGKRDYVWTIDTLSYPGSLQTLMRDMWASSPNDVYVVGHNDQNRGQMYHYNGRQWSPVHLAASDGGTIVGPFDLSAIYGFGPNDIYAVGQRIYQNPTPPPNFLDSSLIVHFDGSQWRDVPLDRGRVLIDVIGSSSQNIWTVGSGKHSIYHYVAGTWSRDSVHWSKSVEGNFGVYAIASITDNELYALAGTHINDLAKDVYYFFHTWQDSVWTLVDSAIIEPGRIEIKWGYSKLWRSPWGKLYSVGLGVYEWNQSQWIKIFNSDMWLRDIFGTSERNIFVVGQFGGVYHYNGTDWYRFTSFPPSAISLTTEWFFGSWTDGHEVFIVGQDASGRNSLVLHGK